MNIFALDADPAIAAKYHNNKHVVKMILELCQILSTAHRVLDGEQGFRLSANNRKIKTWMLSDHREQILYSATHVNHPSCIYARSGSFEYTWTQQLLVELCKEYTYRYGKVHASESKGVVMTLSQLPNNIKQTTEFRLPTPAMPDEYKTGDVVESYRNYYIGSKQRMAQWNGKNNGRDVPDWYQLNMESIN